MMIERGRPDDFLRPEGAPADDRHPHGAEVIRRNNVDLGGWFLCPEAVPGVPVMWKLLSHELSSNGILAPMAALSTPGSARTRSRSWL